MRIGRVKNLVIDRCFLEKVYKFLNESDYLHSTLKRSFIIYMESLTVNDIIRNCNVICSSENMPDPYRIKWQFRSFANEIVRMYKCYIDKKDYYNWDYNFDGSWQEIIEKYFL